MKFRIERVAPDGSWYPRDTKSKTAWKLTTEQTSMELAAKFAALTWEASTFGLLDYPVYMRIQWPGNNVVALVDRVVDISYVVGRA